ncbi:MAG TPA: alpha/beta hydrolase [Gemmatimonadales bacterium]|nr:alpha/beta hydrolase [Gemmatimonadales bacterium]
MRHSTGVFTGDGGLRLFRQSWLPDSPPRALVVNLHGLGDHSGLYEPLVTHMTGAGFAVHSYDARGNGRSEGQRAYIERWSDFRNDLGIFLGNVRAEAPALPLFVIGTSLGGLAALDYAAAHPAGLAGVVAISPPLGKLAVPAHLLALGRVLSRVWPRFSLQAGMDLGGLARDPDVAATVLGDPLFHRLGTARLATEVEATIARLRRLRDFPVPLLLLHGGADRMVPPDGSRAFHAGLGSGDHTYLEYPAGYHALTADTGKERVLADITRWMDQRAGAPDGS